MNCPERDTGVQPSGQRIKALLHFVRGSAREGDHKDLLGRDKTLFDQVLHTVGDDIGFAGAGAREHEHRTFSVADRLLLGRVAPWQSGSGILLYHGYTS